MMLRALVIGLIAAAAAAQSAQVPPATDAVNPDAVPPRVEAFLKTCETSRRGAIAQLEFELRGLRARDSNSPEATRRVAKIEANLQALRANTQPVVPALSFPPDVGAIGRLPRLTCHVDQVLSGNEMLVRCLFSLKVRSVRQFQPRLETVVRPVSFLVRGHSTRKMTEGADVQLLDVFEISGKHTYQSVAGQSITVLVLSPFDMRAVEPYFRAMAAGK